MPEVSSADFELFQEFKRSRPTPPAPAPAAPEVMTIDQCLQTFHDCVVSKDQAMAPAPSTFMALAPAPAPSTFMALAPAPAPASGPATAVDGLKVGVSVNCKANDPTGATVVGGAGGGGSKVYRYTGNKTINHYPNPTIAKSWNNSWASINTIDCAGLNAGPIMGMAPALSTTTYQMVGEGGCTADIAAVRTACSAFSSCDTIGQQTNGCWHCLKTASTGDKSGQGYKKLYSLHTDRAEQRVYGDNGTVSCATYCAGTGGGPWNNELPVDWKGATCVSAGKTNNLACSAVGADPATPGQLECVCKNDPSTPWVGTPPGTGTSVLSSGQAIQVPEVDISTNPPAFTPPTGIQTSGPVTYTMSMDINIAQTGATWRSIMNNGDPGWPPGETSRRPAVFISGSDYGPGQPNKVHIVHSNDKNENSSIVSTFVATLGQYFNLTWVVDAGKLTTYINGVPDATGTFSTTFNWSKDNAWKWSPYNTQYPTRSENVAGPIKIKNAYWFNKALTPAEIKTIAAPPGTGTSGYAHEGSPFGGLVGRRNWRLILILFLLVIMLWIVAKKM